MHAIHDPYHGKMDEQRYRDWNAWPVDTHQMSWEERKTVLEALQTIFQHQEESFEQLYMQMNEEVIEEDFSEDLFDILYDFAYDEVKLLARVLKLMDHMILKN
ncbi:MAG: hypothetical protein HFF02_05965 [Erysipelotrichaceae bacterium]|nr:hypothetical protein [Erysipelotrichaceae bacterium]